jgi:DNA-binding FadR family transcriptional regulator
LSDHIHQKTVVDQAMDRIRKLISSGLYQPGDKIPTEQELANDFGIGRSSIREALKIFQYLGILESRVSKGTFLSGRSRISSEVITWSIILGDNDMWDILELRQIIEETAFLSLMTRLLSAPDSFQSVFKKLEAEIQNMRLAEEESSLNRLSLADYTFHSIIITYGGNRLFLEIFKTLKVFIQEENMKTYHSMHNPYKITDEHEEIMNSMWAGNLDKAVSQHHTHFLRIRGLLAPGSLPKGQ